MPGIHLAGIEHALGKHQTVPGMQQTCLTHMQAVDKPARQCTVVLEDHGAVPHMFEETEAEAVWSLLPKCSPVTVIDAMPVDGVFLVD